jgi:hypothetical protein
VSIQVRFLEPREYPLADKFFDREGIPRLDPNWSKIGAAIDLDTGRIVGAICLQLVAHVEPIIIAKAYRGSGLWREMAEIMDGYLSTMARQGAIAGVYAQPTHQVAEHLCQEMGMSPCEHNLWVKIYNPDHPVLTPKGDE